MSKTPSSGTKVLKYDNPFPWKSFNSEWRYNERDGVSNHQRLDCLFNRRRSKETSKLRVTGHCEGNSPVTGEFPTQRASNAENVSILWRHHSRMHTLQSNTTLMPGYGIIIPSLPCTTTWNGQQALLQFVESPRLLLNPRSNKHYVSISTLYTMIYYQVFH